LVQSFNKIRYQFATFVIAEFYGVERNRISAISPILFGCLGEIPDNDTAQMIPLCSIISQHDGFGLVTDNRQA